MTALAHDCDDCLAAHQVDETLLGGSSGGRHIGKHEHSRLLNDEAAAAAA